MKQLEWEYIKSAINEAFKPVREELASTKAELAEVKAAYDKLLTSWNDTDALRYHLDELGKIEQTTTGTGDPFDPIKYWKEGMAVEQGKFYQCNDNNGYIWEAIKSGVPASCTDANYFDVIF